MPYVFCGKRGRIRWSNARVHPGTSANKIAAPPVFIEVLEPEGSVGGRIFLAMIEGDWLGLPPGCVTRSFNDRGCRSSLVEALPSRVQLIAMLDTPMAQRTWIFLSDPHEPSLQCTTSMLEI